MRDYLPFVIIAVFAVILCLWWLSARKKNATDKVGTEPPEPIAAPSVAAAPPPAVPPVDVPAAANDAVAKDLVSELSDAGEANARQKTPAIAEAGPPDNLLLLKGLGPKVNAILNDLGVTRFAQIAAWDDADISEIDPKLGTFAGRIVKENWVDQARLLAAGDSAAFEKKYGALGSQAKG